MPISQIFYEFLEYDVGQRPMGKKGKPRYGNPGQTKFFIFQDRMCAMKLNWHQVADWSP